MSEGFAWESWVIDGKLLGPEGEFRVDGIESKICRQT
jgi:hypothetical protein